MMSIEQRNELVVSHLDRTLIAMHMNGARIPNNVMDSDDVRQEAALGLIDAADRFDDSHGVLFRSFANRRVEGAVIDAIRRFDIPRKMRSDINKNPQIADTYDVSVVVNAANPEMLEDLENFGTEIASDTADPCLAYELKEEAEIVVKAIQELSTKLQMILIYHYWYDLNFTEISRIWCVSHAWISTLHRHALEKLRNILKHQNFNYRYSKRNRNSDQIDSASFSKGIQHYNERISLCHKTAR